MASSKQSESEEGAERRVLSPSVEGPLPLGKAGERPLKCTAEGRVGGGSAQGSKEAEAEAEEEAEEEGGTSIATLVGLWSPPFDDGGGEGEGGPMLLHRGREEGRKRSEGRGSEGIAKQWRDYSRRLLWQRLVDKT